MDHCRRQVLIVVLVVVGCQGPPVAAPELPAAVAKTLLGTDTLAKLLAIDAVEASRNHGFAPLLFVLMDDANRPSEERSRAAAALLTLGYESGQRFCLAVLAANLQDFEARDREFRLPRSERWAFAREIAFLAIEGRLTRCGMDVPRYDVNLGAPDLAKATRALEAALATAGRPRPAPSRKGLEGLIPERGPLGVPADRWTELRRRCVAAADR